MMEIRENYSLKSYNTFDIDVNCRYFAEASREDELLEFVSTYAWAPHETLILGGGSNFLFTGDYEGTVIYPAMKEIEPLDEDAAHVYVRVGAGVEWDDFVAWAVARGYGGVENLSLIPGHVGASPVQNVGAYGAEAGDTIFRVEAIDCKEAKAVCLEAADCRFAYRDSIFKREWRNRFIITRVIFRLDKTPHFRLAYGNLRDELDQAGGALTLQQVRDAIIRIRSRKLPDVRELPSAGSFFKNPVVSKPVADNLLCQYPEMPLYTVDDERRKLAAAWMIEQCGWKGKTLGKAGVYEQQALVLVNRGGADGTDISRLANEIKKSVFLKFGVWIEPEVCII